MADKVTPWKICLRKSGRWITRKSKWISDNWPLLAICGILIAWIVHDVSIFQPFEEMAARQAEYRGKKEKREDQMEMVERHLVLGNTFLDNSRFEAAKEQFNSVEKLDEMNPNAQMGLFKTGVYEAMQKNYIPEVVDRRIKFILAENAKDPHGLVLMGNLYEQIGRIDEAMAQYEEALKFDPESSPFFEAKPSSAYFALGLLYRRQGKNDKALEMGKNAVALSPFNERYLTNLACVYREKGDYKDAIEMLEKVLNLDNEYLLPYFEIALAYWMKGELDWAVTYQDRLAAMLKEEKYTDLSKNNDVWVFKAGGEVVELFSIKEKRCYALYSLAATYHFLGMADESREYGGQARAMGVEDGIPTLVREDVARFVKKHPTPGNEQKTKEYLESFVKP